MIHIDFHQAISGETRVLSWKDLKKDVKALDPLLAKIIDDINPGKEFRIYRVHYPYGAEILRAGRFHLPNEAGQIVPLSDASIPPEWKKDLNYNQGANPVLFGLKNAMELSFICKGRSWLFELCRPGCFFGSSPVLDETAPSNHPNIHWGLTAGARSVFMLSKISESVGNNNLKRAFQLPVDKPDGFLDHWEMFRCLANHKGVLKEPWQCEVLFFGAEWFSHFKDPVWQPFHHYLLQDAWHKTAYFRNLVLWNGIYSILRESISTKLSPHSIETVKHLFAMGVSALPGFAPALDEETLPVRAIQAAYLDVYRLKHYLPIIMEPAIFQLEQERPRPIYYSFQMPTVMGLTIKSVSSASTITELGEIQFLLQKYLGQLRQDELPLEGTLIYYMAQTVAFDFIHTSVKHYDGLKAYQDVVAEDKSFTEMLVKHPDNTVFPENSSFFRGCVRISKLAL